MSAQTPTDAIVLKKFFGYDRGDFIGNLSSFTDELKDMPKEERRELADLIRIETGVEPLGAYV